MKSQLAQQARQSLLERVKQMTPAQRIEAFINLSQQVKLLHEAGKQRRQQLSAAAKHPTP